MKWFRQEIICASFENGNFRFFIISKCHYQYGKAKPLPTKLFYKL